MMLGVYLQLALLAVVGCAFAQSQSQASNEDQKWRVPLAEKAEIIQQNILDVHDVEGTYVPTVPLPPDHTVLGVNGDMHTSSWTGCYILAHGFRLGWAREYGTPADVEAALNLGGRTLGGITMLSRISGTPGLLARYVMYGHGVGPEERGYNNARNWWFQGKGEYRDFRYRSHPSHHNYHHMLRGLGIYYYFLTKDNPNPSPREQAQIDSTRMLVREMMEFAYKSNNMVLIREDGSVSAQQLLSGVAEGHPSTKALMATNCLKFGYWITGDRWYRDRYRELVERFNYRDAGVIPPDQWQGGSSGLRTPDFDDTEHTLASLWLVSQIEEDQQLKDFYLMAISQIFASKHDKKRSVFNYIYAGATGNLGDADLPGALETMRLFPSAWLILPIMNSIRTDIEVGETMYGLGTIGVLPFNQQPYDNAYTWKGNPYALDRYLAREITALTVSGEDPYVWMLADAGALYITRDNGETFEVLDKPDGVAVRDVTFAANKNRVAVIAADDGVYWTQRGGYGPSWIRAEIGAPDSAVSRVLLDPGNPNVVWAIAADGVYRSEDLGIEEVGKAWTKVSRPFPVTDEVVFGVVPGENAIIYATSRGRIYHHALGAATWTMMERDTEEYHILPEYQAIIGNPRDPRNAYFLMQLTVWGREWPLLLRTTDAAQSIAVTGLTLPRPYFPSEGTGLEQAGMMTIAFDQRNPQTVYGAGKGGFFRSDDGGVNWRQSNTGLRIPLVYNVIPPPEHPGKLYASTPAGLHVSTDGGESWSSPILVLNGLGTRRTDRGGMGYLVAYWPARYFGLISDEEANRPPEEW